MWIVAARGVLRRQPVPISSSSLFTASSSSSGSSDVSISAHAFRKLRLVEHLANRVGLVAGGGRDDSHADRRQGSTADCRWARRSPTFDPRPSRPVEDIMRRYRRARHCGEHQGNDEDRSGINTGYRLERKLAVDGLQLGEVLSILRTSGETAEADYAGQGGNANSLSIPDSSLGALRRRCRNPMEETSPHDVDDAVRL